MSGLCHIELGEHVERRWMKRRRSAFRAGLAPPSSTVTGTPWRYQIGRGYKADRTGAGDENPVYCGHRVLTNLVLSAVYDL